MTPTASGSSKDLPKTVANINDAFVVVTAEALSELLDQGVTDPVMLARQALRAAAQGIAFHREGLERTYQGKSVAYSSSGPNGGAGMVESDLLAGLIRISTETLLSVEWILDPNRVEEDPEVGEFTFTTLSTEES